MCTTPAVRHQELGITLGCRRKSVTDPNDWSAFDASPGVSRFLVRVTKRVVPRLIFCHIEGRFAPPRLARPHFGSIHPRAYHGACASSLTRADGAPGAGPERLPVTAAQPLTTNNSDNPSDKRTSNIAFSLKRKCLPPRADSSWPHKRVAAQPDGCSRQRDTRWRFLSSLHVSVGLPTAPAVAKFARTCWGGPGQLPVGGGRINVVAGRKTTKIAPFQRW